jgi:hypothetical protein
MRALARKPIFLILGVLLLAFVLYEARDVLHLSSFSGSKLLAAVREANPYYLLLAMLAI